MSLYMNGTKIGTALGNLIHNNINVTMVYCNGVKVWEVSAPPGSQLFTESGTFTVPVGIYSVQVTVVGAGGSGANGQTNGGGGYAGAVVTTTVSVTPGQVIPVTVGAGGIAREYAASGGYISGAAGGNSAFGSVVAAGGSGGVAGGSAYAGNGGATVYGTVDGGIHVYGYFTGYGGQGCIGNGGRAGGGVAAYSANAGGVGAGGGGACFATFGTWSGAGGRGQVLIAWN